MPKQKLKVKRAEAGKGISIMDSYQQQSILFYNYFIKIKKKKIKMKKKLFLILLVEMIIPFEQTKTYKYQLIMHYA